MGNNKKKKKKKKKNCKTQNCFYLLNRARQSDFVKIFDPQVM